METNEKTFRYSYTFKNLGILYLMFLFSCVVGGVVMGQWKVLYAYILVMFGVGMLFLIPYMTFNVRISDSGITKKTLLGKRSLQWFEIGHVSSQGLSLKLHGHDDNTSLSINPRMDGSTEILDLIFSKRSDLFDDYMNKPLLRSYRNNIGSFLIGLVLVMLALLLYFIKDYVFTAGLLGLFFWLQALFSWYLSPRSITLEGNKLVVHHVNKSVSILADDIVSVQTGKTQQGQITSVYLVFPNGRLMEISGYKQSPFIIYPVLKKWHETYAKEQPSHLLNRN